jgi:hypothetical protein
MPNSIRIVNLAAVINGLGAFVQRSDEATMFALGAVAGSIQAQAARNASGPHHDRGVGHVAWAGEGPNVVSGDLRRSIRVKMRRQGFGSYSATVGPSMVYGRAVELGNPMWKSGVKYPYLVPAYKTIEPKAQDIFTKAYKRRMK